MHGMPEPDDQAPPSPCIQVCAMDTDGYCLGCHRTLDEIGRWTSLSAAEQWAVIEACRERATAQQA